MTDEAIKVLESKEVQEQILSEVKYDVDRNRVTFSLTNKRSTAVEARIVWSNLNNLEIAEVEQREIPYMDQYSRTTLQSGQTKVCTLLSAIRPSEGFSYSYSVIVSEVANTLPPVSRVIERTEIRKGILVVANWYGPLRQMHLIVSNKRETAIRLKLVWTVFENMRILRGGSGEIYVPPSSEATYAVMTPRDRDKAWKYRYSFRMVENATEPTAVSEIARDAGLIQQQLSRFKEIFFKVAYNVMRRSPESLTTLDAANSTSAASFTDDAEEEKSVVLPSIPELLTNSDFLAELDRTCAQQKIGYIDLDFPPVETSLVSINAKQRRRATLGVNYQVDALVHPKLRSVTWRRLSDILGSDHCSLLSPTELDPRGVRASANEPSSWLAAGLASLAEHPEIIDRLFVTKSVSPRGWYALKLCVGGVRQVVTVDDYVPYSPMLGPIFSWCHGNELWVPLVGKAYAKALSSYANVIGGMTIQDAYLDLTGCPVESVPLRQREKSMEAVWKRLCEWTRMSFLMAALSDRVDSAATGLASKQYYTVLGAVAPKKATDPLLVMLRATVDPGATWTGAWSVRSPLWQKPEYASLQSIEPIARMLDNPIAAQDTGEFFMPFQEFCQHFRMLTVCYYRRDWQEVRFPLQFTRNVAYSNKQAHIDETASVGTSMGGTGSMIGSENTSRTQHSPTDILCRYTSNFFLIEVATKTTLFAALHQKEIELQGATNDDGTELPPRIGYVAGSVIICEAVPRAILEQEALETGNTATFDKFRDKYGNHEVLSRYVPGRIIADSSALLNRYNSAECHDLEPGTYFIIPHSFGPIASNEANPHVSDLESPPVHNFVLALHSLCPIKARPCAFSSELVADVIFDSIKLNGAVVSCNVPGLCLYDWCAKKSAYFAIEMTDEFAQATGKSSVIFKHALSLTDNVHTVSGIQVIVPLKPGDKYFLNAAVVVQTHKAWKYKHRWEFLYQFSENDPEEDHDADE